MALAQDVAALRGPAMTLCEAVPRASKGAIGAVDRFIQDTVGVTRTLASVLKQMWGIALSVEMEVLPWLVRHATWILNRFDMPEITEQQHVGHCTIVTTLGRFSDLDNQYMPMCQTLPRSAFDFPGGCASF